MHAALRQPQIELYTGLVETGVGLVPAGGGCKEMVLRAIAAANAARADSRGESTEVYDTIRSVFETIAMAKVSTSAFEARGLRIVEDSDAITMNRERLASDAKALQQRYIRPKLRHLLSMGDLSRRVRAHLYGRSPLPPLPSTLRAATFIAT